MLQSGHTYTANEMNEFIGGKHQGGIRYSGDFPDLQRMGVVIGGGAEAIYADRVGEHAVFYYGEGQEGDQKLSSGNRALVWAHFHSIPVHVFLNQGKNRYEYIGAHQVEAVRATVAEDRSGRDRGAFLFRLVPDNREA
ncbi:MAG TPA: hypothetical protein VFE20_09180 [Thermoleophilia bacterium]|nr:hypothetical protein [Thermoleophilia bacterium]